MPKPRPQGVNIMPIRPPKNSDELHQAFTAWLMDGGDDSRAVQARRTGEFLAQPWPDDIVQLLDAQKTLASLLAWVNAQLADAAEFTKMADALYSRDVLTDPKISRLGQAHANRELAMQTAPYHRALKALERLSATATHQLDGIRTQISALRELAKLDGSPAKG